MFRAFRSGLFLFIGILSLILSILLALTMSMYYMDEDRTRDFGVESSSLAPGMTDTVPDMCMDDDSGDLDEDWELRGTVIVKGPEALVAIGVCDEINELAEYLQRGGSPHGINNRPGLHVYYLRNETFNFSIPVEVKGQYMVAVHNTFRPVISPENFTEEGRLDYCVKFYAVNTMYAGSTAHLERALLGGSIGLFTLLTSIFFFFFTVLRNVKDENLFFPEILARYSKKVLMIIILSGMATLTTLFDIGVCFVYPFFLLGLMVYSLIMPKESKTQVDSPFTPSHTAPIGTSVQTELDGERITLHLKLTNNMPKRLDSVEVTPVLPPGEALTGLGSEYIAWIEPGEEAQVDIIFTRYRGIPKEIPIRIKITYYVGGKRGEYLSEEYRITG